MDFGLWWYDLFNKEVKSSLVDHMALSYCTTTKLNAVRKFAFSFAFFRYLCFLVWNENESKCYLCFPKRRAREISDEKDYKMNCNEKMEHYISVKITFKSSQLQSVSLTILSILQRHRQRGKVKETAGAQIVNFVHRMMKMVWEKKSSLIAFSHQSFFAKMQYCELEFTLFS